MAEETTSHIMSESDYNPVEAKFCASLFWLVFHATEDGDFDDIPPEITCPTERNEEGGFLVRPSVVSFLCEGVIYMKVCTQILNLEKQIQSFWDVIQELSNAGVYVVDLNDQAVTEERLAEQETFDMESHLALMDALIVAFINQSVNIQQVVDAVRRFATFNPAKELPFDLEDAFVLWLNKINTTNNINVAKKKQPENGPTESPRRFRFKRDQVVERSLKLFPKLDDFQRDIADGKALLSLILFYCPEILELENIKLSGSLTDEDIISNIDLFRDLCAQHICTSIFALRTEDFIYKYPELKNNLIALFCEIFTSVELEKNEPEIENEVGENDEWNARNSGAVIDPKQDRLVIGEELEIEKVDGRLRIGTDQLPVNSTEDAILRATYDIAEYKESLENHVDEPSTRVSQTKLKQSTDNIDDVTGVYGTNGNSFKDHVDLSIEDELQRLRLHSRPKPSESFDSLPPKPGAVSSAAKTGRIRQPLLSKRSKKQLANFDDGERCQSNEDLSALELEDFDLKRSHSMSSVIEKANYVIDPKRSIRAWEGGKSSPDINKSKSNKISLDFKPDVSPYRSFKSNESYTIEREPNINIERMSWQKSSDVEESSFEDCNVYYNHQSIDGRPSCNQENLTSNNIKDSRYTETYKRGKALGYEATSFDPRESTGSTSSEEMRKFRDEIKERLDLEKNERVNIEPEFVEPQLEDDEMFGFGGSAVKKPPLPARYGVSPRPNRIIGNISDRKHEAAYKTKDDDDDLSTIAESSEPSTPTVYSFESVLSNEESKNSVLSTSDEVTPHCPTTKAESTSTNRNYDLQAASAEESGTAENRFETLSHSKENSQLVASQIDLGSSYTITDTRLPRDSNVTAGLPVTWSNRTTDDATARVQPNAAGGRNSRLGSDHGSDVDDVPINVRVGSRSSSSGISADEVRDEVVSEGEDGRPGIAVYSSLSEHTAGGSPTNFDAKTNEGDYCEEIPVENDIDDEACDLTPVKPEVDDTDNGVIVSAVDDNDGGYDVDSVSRVKRKTYLSLDFDEDEHTSTSALAVCIEPVEDSDEGDVSSSPSRSKHNWSYMEVEIKEEDPSRILGNADKNANISKDAEGMTPSVGKKINGEVVKHGKKKENLNTTTSWNEISRDDTSDFWKNLKKPQREQNHCLTKLVDGPVMNWAEYAKLKNVENNATSESEDENTGKSPREPLAPRLAILKMQLEERRRHIEEEKKRMIEQWNEERIRVGQQAFWFAVGNKDGKVEDEKTKNGSKNVDATETSKKAGLMFFPFSDENDPKKIPPKSSKKSTVRSESPPNECSTPVTRVPAQPEQERLAAYDGNYTVHDNRIGSQDSNYTINYNRIGSQDGNYTVNHNRIGSQTMLESSTVHEQGITYIVEKHVDGSVITVDDNGDQVFYDDYHNVPDYVKRALRNGLKEADRKQPSPSGAERSPRDSNRSRNSPRDLTSARRPQVNADTQNTRGIQSHNEPVHADKRQHRTAWDDPVKLSARNFPSSVVRHMEHGEAGTESLIPEPETHFYYEESLGNVYRRSSDEGLPDHLLTERRAMKLVSEELQSDPVGYDSREQCYDSDQALPPDSWDLASARTRKKKLPREESSDNGRGIPMDVAMKDDQAKNAFAPFDIKTPKPNVTPRTGEKSRPGIKEQTTDRHKIELVANVVEESAAKDDSPRDRHVLISKVEDQLVESPAELTPDQMKKREKFMQNRMKRKQEEKAKKEAEMEKRKRKEEKMRERKASIEKRDREEQNKRKRGDEARRKQQEDELQRRNDEQPWRLRGGDRDDERPAPHQKPRSQFSGNNNGSHGNIRQINNETFNQPSPAQSNFAEYKGPPVYVKPTGKSNRQIMINAITHCCLSGEVNKEAKEKSLQVLSLSNSTHFFVLFREGLKFRGLYSYVQEHDEAHKIYGVGPKVISNQMVEKLYKYSSGGKSFSQIPAKSLSIQVDGIVIKKEFWQSSKPTALPSKTDSNLKKVQTYSSRSDMLKKGSPKTSRR